MDFKLNVIFLVIVALCSITFAKDTRNNYRWLVNRKRYHCDDPWTKSENCTKNVWVYRKEECIPGCWKTDKVFQSKAACEEMCIDYLGPEGTVG